MLTMVQFGVQAIVVGRPLLATGTANLLLALAISRALLAPLQAGRNVYAGKFEKKRALSVMGRCLGAWALGLMAGSLGRWRCRLGWWR